MKEYQKPIVIADEMLIEDVVLSSSMQYKEELKFGEGDGEKW